MLLNSRSVLAKFTGGLNRTEMQTTMKPAERHRGDDQQAIDRRAFCQL